MVSLPSGEHVSSSVTQKENLCSSQATGNMTGIITKAQMSGTTNGTSMQVPGGSIPLSSRRSQRLDMSTVERKGQRQGLHPPKDPTSYSIHGLIEAPTFRPTEEEFRDPLEYIRLLAPDGRKYGIIKVIPPDSWNPEFAIDTESFHLRTRRQQLNSVEGGTRSSRNYIDQLTKFHQQNGQSLTRFPSVDKRPLDLYKLKKAVDNRGGFEKVCKGKKWAEIGRDLGYSGKIMSSLSTSLKNSYQRWLQPYEDYLRIAKPGVQHLLGLENGRHFTPSPNPSPSKPNTHHNFIFANQSTYSPTIKTAETLRGQINDMKTHLFKPPDDNISSIHDNKREKPEGSNIPKSSFTPVNARASSEFVPFNPPKQASQQNGTDLKQAVGINQPSTSNTFIDFTSQISGRIKDFPHMKRRISTEATYLVNSDEFFDNRKSKRMKKEAIPTVAGSHMMQPRISTAIPKVNINDHVRDENEDVSARTKRNGVADIIFSFQRVCDLCGTADASKMMSECDSCERFYHHTCLEPPLQSEADQNWHCPKCLVGTGDFGFEDGGIYSLRQFQEKANNFKQKYFRTRPSQNSSALEERSRVSEADVEREFWRLVESITDTVEVEYGADIHTTTHGSGFPTIEKNLRDPYASDSWNLNILPLHPDSLFRHIKSDISGMTVPWLYVGMCFSTFCWHNEDHYTYSANYHHLGEPKKWYGIPAADALKFEDAMRRAVPELFESQPDLLFQLVTLLPPDQLRKAGVSVYTLDQRAGEFIITFPQAYHAGFNYGFNINEAVNFAPADWEPFGEAGVQRLQDFRRQACFSHDELLLTIAERDPNIKTAKWLSPALVRLQKRELSIRDNFAKRHREASSHQCSLEIEERISCSLSVMIDQEQHGEDENICSYCRTYAYLSRFVCTRTGIVLCLLHAGLFKCCDDTDDTYRLNGKDEAHMLYLHLTMESISSIVEKVDERARIPESWAGRVERLLEDDPRPPLKALRSLLQEGEKIPWSLPQLPELRQFVERANEWVEEATNYITRKQQNRRKNEKLWRKGSAAKVAEMEERDRDLRNIENITKLLREAEAISFECPEILELQKRADAISEFRNEACTVLANISSRTTQELQDMIEIGKSFNVDIPEIERLDKMVQQVRWYDEFRQRRPQIQTLQSISDFVEQGETVGIPFSSPEMMRLRDDKQQGELWECKAKEALASENIHLQQLDILSKQAATLPVPPDILTTVNSVMKKQREARNQIRSLYEGSLNPDPGNRPRYKEVRFVMEAIAEFNGKPQGFIELEREQKRHEDWMRRGKKLFGKANAPLHILLSHMLLVESRNEACFDLRDQPRMPVEPSSRANSPSESQEVDGSISSRDVFCICRKPEAGMMIECELCHEWYHGKCLKIARGKVKEDDKYTCPICDYRVKIPRDAARPKLEDLQAWQDEISSLPFQPEEEDCLARIIDTAQSFRQFMSSYVNPMLSNPDELTTQRFYLRKIEGADILLVTETNFFRQELHKWAPIASNPPPPIQVSLSTRKPRPTKQQRLMNVLGIENPDNIPPHLRPKPYNMARRRSSHSQAQAISPLQPAPPSGSSTPNAGLRSISVGDQALLQSAPSSGNSLSGHKSSITNSMLMDPLLIPDQTFAGSPAMLDSPQISGTDASMFDNSTIPYHTSPKPDGNVFPTNMPNGEDNTPGTMDVLFTNLVDHEQSPSPDKNGVDKDAEVDGRALVDEFLHGDDERS